MVQEQAAHVRLVQVQAQAQTRVEQARVALPRPDVSVQGAAMPKLHLLPTKARQSSGVGSYSTAP